MRPRLIASVPGLGDPSLSPAQRFEKFARLIVSVPKTKADKETKKARKPYGGAVISVKHARS